ncbi:MAG: hypothetical protein RL677_441 [Actinomycetota bacterium]|jgi:HAD superfamily hydrolase (TIGR01490 family)
MKTAFFDLDNTLIKGSSLFYLTKSLLRKKLITKREMARFVAAQIKFIRSRTEDQYFKDYLISKSLSLIKNRSVEELAELLNNEILTKLNQNIYPIMRERVLQHLEAGHSTWIITASPVEIASLVAKQLNMSGALATRAEIQNGRYTGQLHGQVLHGAMKAKALMKFSEKFSINLDEAFGYSDSINDLPLLCAVGNPSVVNPNYELLQIAHKNQWAVIQANANKNYLAPAA